MARERYDRPEAGKVKAMVAAATGIDARLGSVIAQEPEQRRCAQIAAQALFQERVRLALQEMDVEHINKGKQGIRVQLLRDAGFVNVYQVSQLSFGRLCAIDGLGERSAEKILGIVREISQNTKQTIRIRIQVEQPGKTDEDLVRALYVLIHSRKPRQVCGAIYEAAHAPVQQELALAKQSLGGFGWLFKSRKKKDEILTGVERLQARLRGPFGDGVALGEYDKVQAVTSEVYWKDYIQNAPAYYAELEQLGVQWEKQDAAPGGLSAQLAAEIEAQTLDLRYLKATLRSYQTFGTKYIVHQKKSLLGDEMGLGKTIQAIAAMAAQKAEGHHHFMVVCPASVLVNWCREISKHSTLEVTKVHGNDARRIDAEDLKAFFKLERTAADIAGARLADDQVIFCRYRR